MDTNPEIRFNTFAEDESIKKAAGVFSEWIKKFTDEGIPVFVTDKKGIKKLSDKAKPFSLLLKLNGVDDKQIFKLAELYESAAKLDKSIRDNADEKVRRELEEAHSKSWAQYQDESNALAKRYGKEMFTIFKDIPNENRSST
jgi:hypothetical protein